LGVRPRLLGRVGEFDAAGLAPPARVDLGLDDDGHAVALCDSLRLLGGRGDLARRDRDPAVAEKLLRLILVDVHSIIFFRWTGRRMAALTYRAGHPLATRILARSAPGRGLRLAHGLTGDRATERVAELRPLAAEPGPIAVTEPALGLVEEFERVPQGPVVRVRGPGRVRRRGGGRRCGGAELSYRVLE